MSIRDEYEIITAIESGTEKHFYTMLVVRIKTQYSFWVLKNMKQKTVFKPALRNLNELAKVKED